MDTPFDRERAGRADCGAIAALDTKEADLTKAPMISIIDDDPFVRAATDGLVRSLG